MTQSNAMDTFNSQQRGWPRFTFSATIVPQGAGPQTRDFLAHPAFELADEPIDDGMNEGTNGVTRISLDFRPQYK